MIVQKGIVFNDSNKDNHSRKHSKDDIINLAKVMVGMSILTQITRAKAVNSFHSTKIQASLSTQFLSLGQIVKATATYVDPTTAKQITQAKSFIVGAILQPTGNNRLDQAVIIDRNNGNTLFHKSGKYDTLIILARSPAYVDTVQKEIQSLYGTNIGVITPKAIIQTQQQFVRGNNSFMKRCVYCIASRRCRNYNYTLYIC
jgi:hypothetical protein